MIKKNPSYRVTVYTQDKTLTVEYPITCKFNSSRGMFSQANRCTIELFNLNPTSREAFFKDALTLDKDYWKYIKLEAGWNGQLSQIFFGRILQAYSSKDGGAVDVITHVDCQPFDIFNTQSAYTFEAGITYKEAFKTICADLSNCQIGNIGTLEGTFKTQRTYCGKTIDCLNELTGGNTFVDNGVINAIMSNEVIDVPVPLVTDDNGLLGTPIRRDASLTLKMLFEPTLIVGQLLEVKSNIAPIYNGQYKVLGFTHDCLISPTQAGTRITTVDLWIAPLLKATDINITGETVINDSNNVSGFNKVNGEKVTFGSQTTPTGVREVYIYLQRNGGKMPNTKITKNISWKELIGNDNTDNERYKELSLGILTNCYNIAQMFQKVIDRYFTGARVTINSGWRSVRNNTNCKGKSNSKHLSGLAIDFRIPGYNTYQVYNIFRQVWGGYVQYYQKLDFVHVQVNPGKGSVNDR